MANFSRTSEAFREAAPLLSGTLTERTTEPASSGTDLPSFKEHVDPDEPVEWPTAFKWAIVAMLASMSFMVTFTCTCVVPIARAIARDFGDSGIDADYATVIPITIWEVGEAIGPLLIAPLSEVFGRYPVLTAANMLFAAGITMSATSGNMGVFILSRAFTGMAVASNVLGPAVIGDIFEPDQRGKGMSMMSFCTLLGGSIGPAVSGYITQHSHWRFVLWLATIVASICGLVIILAFRETYGPVIARRRNKSPQQRLSPTVTEYGSVQQKRHGDDTPPPGFWEIVFRPMVVLSGSGVLAALSLTSATIFANFYILSTTLPDFLEGLYGLSQSATGSIFLANGIGSLIGITICNFCLDKIYVMMRDSNYGIGLPEHRLPLAILASLMMPAALIMYGWAAHNVLPLPVLICAVILIRMFISIGIVSLISYVVDACGMYSASALTGVIVVRCLYGAFLPLGVAWLIRLLGIQGGLTVLACINLATASIPLLLFYRGSVWRTSCRYTLG